MYISRKKELDNSSNQDEISYFDSIYQIYYYDYDKNIPEKKVSIHWTRVFFNIFGSVITYPPALGVYSWLLLCILTNIEFINICVML